MANYTCTNGHRWKGRSSLSPSFTPREMQCPRCGGRAETLKRGNGFRADRESAARKRARQEFNRAALQHGCFYSGYRSPDGRPRRKGHDRCEFPMDAHHIVEKQWIEANYADLPEDALLAILFDPRLAAPLCRLGHEGVKTLLIYRDELSEEAVEAAQEIDRRWLDVETPAGTRRKSIYEELMRVCPERRPAATTPREEQ